jgi:hypothetical protein
MLTESPSVSVRLLDSWADASKILDAKVSDVELMLVVKNRFLTGPQEPPIAENVIMLLAAL